MNKVLEVLGIKSEKRITTFFVRNGNKNIIKSSVSAKSEIKDEIQILFPKTKYKVFVYVDVNFRFSILLSFFHEHSILTRSRLLFSYFKPFCSSQHDDLMHKTKRTMFSAH